MKEFDVWIEIENSKDVETTDGLINVFVRAKNAESAKQKILKILKIEVCDIPDSDMD